MKTVECQKFQVLRGEVSRTSEDKRIWVKLVVRDNENYYPGVSREYELVFEQRGKPVGWRWPSKRPMPRWIRSGSRGCSTEGISGTGQRKSKGESGRERPLS